MRETSSGDKQSFLVVNDEAFNRSLLIRHLGNEGFTDVTAAENGCEALVAVREGNFDLVLLDIEMPRMDGLEVLREMKADMRLRDIPVIMISGVEDLESIVQCIELGAEDYLHKPFNPVLLRARVNASLEKKRLRDMQASYMTQIKAEKMKSDGLLDVILPAAAAAELKATGTVAPRSFDDVGLVFCDIVDFTSYCDKHDADAVVSGLQDLFVAFEEITRGHQMEKIKTIGDAFMATAGLTIRNPTPLLSSIKCGLAMAAESERQATGWQVRVGVHVGPVVAGIVGEEKYQFDVWGDTVNTAARMAELGAPGSVAMTYDSWFQVENDCEGRSLGRLEVKGKGLVEVVECTGVV